MKLSTVLKENNRMAIRIQDAPASQINALRRYMASRVPTMAIDYVEFKSNNSILYDEMVAHRLGLTPLTTDLKSYNLPKEEWTEPTGDPRVEVQMTLKVPKVKQNTVVYAKDLESKDKKIAPVHENMPIVKLSTGQDIELIATARLGTGEEHAKWSPAHVWYRHFPHITIKKQPDNADEIAKNMPRIFEAKSGKLSLKKGAEAFFPDRDMSAEGIQVEFKDNDFILVIESWGQLSPEDIVAQAITAYDADLSEFSKLAEGVK